ncbi:MAG: biopolymer transporter ExbD [Syntrophobacterales bacterium]|nr:MAG: biopolymer transporter ExbD [Syntrophobacterales bacterium]
MRLTEQPIKRARIEMIPLIDVVFLLLIFFIYTMLSMTIHKGIPVLLPKAKTGLIEREAYLSISITRDQRIFLDEREVPMEGLLQRLMEKSKGQPHLIVFISGDRRVPYEWVIRVLDTVRASGLNRVSLETHWKE